MMNKRVICPQCKSINLQVLGQNRNFSVGKALGGALLTGGIGALIGFTGKKGYDMFCQDCGCQFKIK